VCYVFFSCNRVSAQKSGFSVFKGRRKKEEGRRKREEGRL
jgi:hypothetical protein